MVQKKKKKRINLTRQQLMENEYNKAEERAVVRIISQQPEQLPAITAPKSEIISGVKKAKSPSLFAVESKPVKSAYKAVSLLLTVTDLCVLLKVSRSTITRMERDGSLPGRVKVGGSVRYHRETIENWLRDSVKLSV